MVRKSDLEEKENNKVNKYTTVGYVIFLAVFDTIFNVQIVIKKFC